MKYWIFSDRKYVFFHPFSFIFISGCWNCQPAFCLWIIGIICQILFSGWPASLHWLQEDGIHNCQSIFFKRAIPTIALPEDDYRFMSYVNFLIPHQKAVQSFTEPYAELGLNSSYSSRLCDWNTPASYKIARIVVRKFQIIIIIVINPDNVTLSDIMTPFSVTLSLFFFPYHNIKFPLFVWGLRRWVVFTIVYKVHCCVCRIYWNSDNYKQS